MAFGVVIIGLGFCFMAMAANEVNYDASGNITQKSAMYWLLFTNCMK